MMEYIFPTPVSLAHISVSSPSQIFSLLALPLAPAPLVSVADFPISVATPFPIPVVALFLGAYFLIFLKYFLLTLIP